jgi:type IV secretion system protein VirD4
MPRRTRRSPASPPSSPIRSADRVDAGRDDEDAASWRGRPHPVIASAARELLNKSDNERSGVLSTAMSFLGSIAIRSSREVTRRCEWRIIGSRRGDRPATLYLVVPPSDISRTKPLIRLILNQIGRRLTEELHAEGQSPSRAADARRVSGARPPRLLRVRAGVHGRLRIEGFLIAQSLNQIEKAYGPNNSILDNCHVRVSFATNDERTAKRVSDALGTATEMRR